MTTSTLAKKKTTEEDFSFFSHDQFQELFLINLFSKISFIFFIILSPKQQQQTLIR